MMKRVKTHRGNDGKFPPMLFNTSGVALFLCVWINDTREVNHFWWLKIQM